MRGIQPPCRRGEDFGACWRRLSPRRLRTRVGRVAFKRRVAPLKGNHVFARPSCITSFHLLSPRMGGARGSSALSSLEERNFTEVGTFQPSFGFKEKQVGLRPLPLPQLQGCSSSVLGRGVRRVGVGLRAGSNPLLPSVIGGKGVRRSWRWQLPRVRFSGPSGFSAASSATFRRGSRKRFLRRRDSRCHPRTDLQLYGHLLVLAPRVGTWARALWQQHPL
jgi:hypothetical protein